MILDVIWVLLMVIYDPTATDKVKVSADHFETRRQCMQEKVNTDAIMKVVKSLNGKVLYSLDCVPMNMQEPNE